MKQLDLLLPFGLPPAEMARDLIRELKNPALAMLLARGKRTDHSISDDFSRALPHEKWLARRFGLENNDSSPAIAASLMQHFGLQANETGWYVVQPVHLHIALDHLVLTDPRQLHLSDSDARELFATVKPLFDELGFALAYGNAQTWFLRADDFAALRTSTPDAASGHNVDIWMPTGQRERDWRRLQNEVQMHWYGHRINDAREMNGLKPVNSLWLWGGPSAPKQNAVAQDVMLFSLPDTVTPFAALSGQQRTVATAGDIFGNMPQVALVLLDALVEASIAGDWGRWLIGMQQLEANWFVPSLQALQAGALEQLTLTMTHQTAVSTYAVSKSSLRKFWVQPSLSRLAQ